MHIYRLIGEDLSHLGGPMGTEYTTKFHIGSYDTLDKAKQAAQKKYNVDARTRPETTLKWYAGSTRGTWHTDDMLFVMYHIVKETVR